MIAALAPYRLIAMVVAAIAISVGGFAFGVKFQRGVHALEQQAHRESAEMAYRRAEKASYDVGRALTVTRDRIRTQTIEIIKEVPTYVPADACPLPGGFARVFDASATGASPESLAGDYDSPIAAQDVAAAIVHNHGAYRDAAAKLKACQQYVRDTLDAIHEDD